MAMSVLGYLDWGMLAKVGKLYVTIEYRYPKLNSFFPSPYSFLFFYIHISTIDNFEIFSLGSHCKDCFCSDSASKKNLLFFHDPAKLFLGNNFSIKHNKLHHYLHSCDILEMFYDTNIAHN